MKVSRRIVVVSALASLTPLAGPVAETRAQTSSLYVQPMTVAEPPPPTFGPRPMSSSLAPALRGTSFTTVDAAEPRQFAVQDLVTIIIRESSQVDSESSLETQKDARWRGKVGAFPRLSLRDLIDLELRPSDITDPVEVDISYGQKFEGEGEYSRKDTMSDRISARIIDVKPNGLLVLEARRETKHDKEEQVVILTGTCRAEDVSIDNTVLSTQLYDMRLNKQHKGALRQTTKKGIITRVLEGLFNF